MVIYIITLLMVLATAPAVKALESNETTTVSTDITENTEAEVTDKPSFVPADGCVVKQEIHEEDGAENAACAFPIGYDPTCYFFDKHGHTTGLIVKNSPKCFFPIYARRKIKHSCYHRTKLHLRLHELKVSTNCCLGFMWHPKLKRYPDFLSESYYPPWSYHGFNCKGLVIAYVS